MHEHARVDTSYPADPVAGRRIAYVATQPSMGRGPERSADDHSHCSCRTPADWPIMKTSFILECEFCGEKFCAAKGMDVHRQPGGSECMAPKQLSELGWTQDKRSKAWRRPKGRR